jgi:hypothetical protein
MPSVMPTMNAVTPTVIATSALVGRVEQPARGAVDPPVTTI